MAYPPHGRSFVCQHATPSLFSELACKSRVAQILTIGLGRGMPGGISSDVTELASRKTNCSLVQEGRSKEKERSRGSSVGARFLAFRLCVETSAGWFTALLAMRVHVGGEKAAGVVSGSSHGVRRRSLKVRPIQPRTPGLVVPSDGTVRSEHRPSRVTSRPVETAVHAIETQLAARRGSWRSPRPFAARDRRHCRNLRQRHGAC